MLENGARCQFRNPRFEGRPFGRKDAKHPQVEVRPGWMRGLSSGSLVVASHSLAVGQTERRPGRDGIGPGPGGAAQAGRGLAVQLRRCPCPRPAPVLWARGPLRPKGEWVRIPASANPRRGLSSSGRRHLVCEGVGKEAWHRGRATNSGQLLRANPRKRRAFIGPFERRPNIFTQTFLGPSESRVWHWYSRIHNSKHQFW